MKNKYQPNFTDPRVSSRIKLALDWANQYLSINNSNWLSARQIQKQFGSQSRPLGLYIKSKLLICTNSYYDPLNAVCKEYRLNLDGYTDLCQQVAYEPKFKASQRITQELQTGELVYETKSNRDFHPVQYLPREKRKQVLDENRYIYKYDIEAAAPTLLLQRAKQVHLEHIQQGNEYTFACPALEFYILNRSQVRKQVAEECYTSEGNIKLVINALLQGAVLTRNKFSILLKQLDYNYDLIVRLQNNPMISDIRRDIKSLWAVLRGELPQRYLIDKNGLQRKQSVTGKDKSGYYRQLEEQVGVVIKRLLKRDRNHYVWIHDGWQCKKIVDEVELVSEVRRQTGFVIKLDRE